MSFSVIISDEAKNSNLEYKWKLSAGKIASGQGTNSISIDTVGLRNENIVAEVKIKGLSANCANTASEVGSVLAKLSLELFDEYGKLPYGEVAARVQNLYIQLGNLPNYQGYIINYGTDKEIAARERQIQRAIRFLKLDTNSVTIVRGGANPNGAGAWTKVWVLPPGAEFPLP